MRTAFRSLSIFNYRLWAAGSLCSYVGTWMQRVAQTWLVLAQLTDNNATAVGVLIAALGTGWVFLINAGSFVAVIGALCLIRGEELHRAKDLEAPSAGLDAIRYVWRRPGLLTAMLMLFLIGTFALNFPLFI